MANLNSSDVVIVGAGPYGLSVAAHLRSRGADFRIFGEPMRSWRTNMPEGMFLKSEGCASALSDPEGRFTLETFSRDRGFQYDSHARPVPIEGFIQYGLAYQQRLVPDLENTQVVAIRRERSTFELRLENGEVVLARRVVLAIGLTFFAHVPRSLRGLPHQLVSHSGDHRDLSVFEGRDVAVVGGGQSALETAALLNDNGAAATVLVQRPAVKWNSVPAAGRRLLPQRVRRPMSGLGAGLRTYLYAEAPMAFRHLPRRARMTAAHTALGPAGAWWLKGRVEGQVPVLLEHKVRSASALDDRVQLRISMRDGAESALVVDHVVAATGYRIKLDNVPFLDAALVAAVRLDDAAPVLSANFESSVPGLHFVGHAAVEAFGPAMRFVYGADFTARRLAQHLHPDPSRRRPATWRGSRCRE